MITLEQAKTALNELINSSSYQGLSAEQKQQALFNISKELSADTTGSKTVLYSGKIGEKTTSDIAESMAKADSNVRIINTSTYLYM